MLFIYRASCNNIISVYNVRAYGKSTLWPNLLKLSFYLIPELIALLYCSEQLPVSAPRLTSQYVSFPYKQTNSRHYIQK